MASGTGLRGPGRCGSGLRGSGLRGSRPSGLGRAALEPQYPRWPRWQCSRDEEPRPEQMCPECQRTERESPGYQWPVPDAAGRKREPLRSPDFIMCSTVAAALAPNPSRSTFGARDDAPRPEHQPGEQHRWQSRVTARKKASRVARPEIPAGRSTATSGGGALAFMAEGLSIDSQHCQRLAGTLRGMLPRALLGTFLGTRVGRLLGIFWSARSKFVRWRVSVMLGVGLGEGSVAHFLIARRQLLEAGPSERAVPRAPVSSRISHFEAVSVVAGCGNEASR